MYVNFRTNSIYELTYVGMAGHNKGINIEGSDLSLDVCKFIQVWNIHDTTYPHAVY